MSLHLKYLYFGAVVGGAWANNPDKCGECNVVAGRASHAGQVKGDVPDLKRYPRSLG